MIKIPCPWCGQRDHDEFDYRAPDNVRYPSLENEDLSAWYEAVYLRDNPKGTHRELWQHTRGCRLWIVLERNTLTHEISSVEIADPILRKAVGESK